MLKDIKERAERTASAGTALARGGTMEPTQGFTSDEASGIADLLALDFSNEAFDLEQFRMGLGVELEHGLRDPATNVTHDDPLVTGKIALAHLRELPDYYTRLADMEAEAGS
jgi:hypothetical protein